MLLARRVRHGDEGRDQQDDGYGCDGQPDDHGLRPASHEVVEPVAELLCACRAGHMRSWGDVEPRYGTGQCTSPGVGRRRPFMKDSATSCAAPKMPLWPTPSKRW